ncbi:MAG: ABC transporter ATP-binding protein [Lachnospiraceae bacterium]|nr:ABC transporter ATP-binding protein [Lachnospiraceae bacterium]
MDRRVVRILKSLGLWKRFVVMLILRSPFDFLNAVLGANMIERFLRLAQQQDAQNLQRSFWNFLLFTVLLFGYNATIWATVSVRADMLFHERLRTRLFETMLSRTQQEMEERSAGDWITRLNSDVDKTANYLTEPINFMHRSIAIVNLVLSSVVLMILNAKLYLAAILVMIPFFFLGAVIIIRKIPTYRKKAQEAFATYVSWMEPIVNTGEAIRIFDGGQITLQKVEEASKEILRENMKAHRLTAFSSLVNIFSGNLGYLLLLLMGNSMMGSEVRDFAQLSKITQYRGEMMRSVMCVSNCQSRMKANLSGAIRVEEVLGKKSQ